MILIILLLSLINATEYRGPRPTVKNATAISFDDSTSELDIADQLIDIIEAVTPNESCEYESSNPDKIRVLSNIIQIELDEVTHDSTQMQSDVQQATKDTTIEMEKDHRCCERPFSNLFIVVTIIALALGLYCSILTTILFFDRQKKGLYFRADQPCTPEEHSLASSRQ